MRIKKNRKIKKQQFLSKKADDFLARRRISKAKKKHRNRLFQGASKEHKQEIQQIFKGRYKKHISAPSNFSLIKNTEETLFFIKKIEECFKKRESVFINLKNVEYIANEAIVVLLSILVQFKANNIDFNGNFPNSEKAKNRIKQSGFFEYLYRKNLKERDFYTFRNEICTHANKNVNAELSGQIVREATKFICGEEKQCTGIQRVFLELMQNTNNHASNNPGEKHWWVTVTKSESDKKVCFSFIDYGVGIFESIRNKKTGKFYKFAEKIKLANLFNPDDNIELLQHLLEGKVHQAVTKEYYRGKGLPGIFDAHKKGKISNLIIISNDVFAICNKNAYNKLNSKLSGTFVYWELDKNNI